MLWVPPVEASNAENSALLFQYNIEKSGEGERGGCQS